MVIFNAGHANYNLCRVWKVENFNRLINRFIERTSQKLWCDIMRDLKPNSRWPPFYDFSKTNPRVIWNKFGYPVSVNYQILNMQGIEWELKPQTENKKAEWRITLDGNNIFTTENWLSADLRWSKSGSRRLDILDDSE